MPVSYFDNRVAERLKSRKKGEKGEKRGVESPYKSTREQGFA